MIGLYRSSGLSRKNERRESDSERRAILRANDFLDGPGPILPPAGRLACRDLCEAWEVQ